jgi:septal ring factor EnvC (AmiA/AmiB activator)
MRSFLGAATCRALAILVGVVFLAGCEESDAIKAKRLQQQTERQALSVRDLALDNQKLADQNKKTAGELDAAKKTIAEQKTAFEVLKKDRDSLSSQLTALKARTADMEKEQARLNKLLQEALENYNRLGKELEDLKKRAAPAEAPPKPAPAAGAPAK